MAKYGRPEESRREQRTLALELPRQIAGTTDPTGDRPPMEVYDITGLEDPDFEELSPITPVDVDTEGPIAEFHFNPALEPGRYRVVVRQQRLNAQDGEPYELTENGRPWTGWTFEVLNASDRHQPSVSGEKETKTDPAPGVDVYLDGEKPGCYGLSGETITVVPEDESAEVELLIKPLLSGINAPLYMDYVSKTHHTVDEKRAVTFAAIAPIKDYRYAVYHGADTVGKVPQTDSKNNHLAGVPVMREPTKAKHAPLISYEKSEVSPQGHPNTYEEVIYTATPQSKIAKPKEHHSARILGPKDIQDAHNTPDTNPRLFDNPIYNEDGVPDESEKVAALDLPLHSKIAVEVDGRRVWSGQTRLLPVFVPPKRAAAELGWTLENGRAKAEALERIWRASIEASRLWGCGLPPGPKPPPTAVEFVLTRLANPIDRTDGVQGESRSQVGQQRTAAKSDRAGERRLSALAALLRDCESSVPMRPEDHVPAQSVGYGASANERYPAAQDNPADIIAPLYDTDREGLSQHYYTTKYISEYHRMGLPASGS